MRENPQETLNACDPIDSVMVRSGRNLVVALATALLATALVAGCIGGDSGEGATSPDAADADEPGNETDGGPGFGSGGDGVPDEDGNASDSPLGPAESRTLYLDTGQSLSAQAPGSGSVALPGGPGNVAYDGDMAVFESRPLQDPAILTPPGSNLTLWIQSQAPLPSNGVIDIGVWFGSTRGIHHIGAATVTAPVLQPGEPTKLEVPLVAQGERGAYVPAGESLQVHVAQLMAPDGSEQVEVLVGGSNASQVDFTARSYDETAVTGTVPSNETAIEGTIPASSDAVGCDAQEGVTTQVHSLSIMEGANLVELTLTADDTPLREDLDMTLFDGDTAILGTSSIDHEENLLLAGPTLEGLQGRDLTLRVVACSAHATSYTVNVAQG
jgi:hypothetical protein